MKCEMHAQFPSFPSTLSCNFFSTKFVSVYCS